MINTKFLHDLKKKAFLELILKNLPESATIYDMENDIYLREKASKYEVYDINNEWSAVSAISESCISIATIKDLYGDIMPVQPEDSLPEFIVSAANKDPDSGVVYPCVRHGCQIFWGLIDDKYPDGKKCVHFEQGFLTNKYRFVDRYEAYTIAVERGQIRRLCPTGSNRLYSEMLY